MGKSAPEAPDPVDPFEVASADAAYNRIEQFTPYGSLTYSDSPDGPAGARNVATLTLDPRVQALVDSQIGLDTSLLGTSAERLAGFDPNQINLDDFAPIQTELDMSVYNPQRIDPAALGLNLGDSLDTTRLPGIPQDVSQLRSDVEDAFFNRANRLLAPELQQQERTLRQRLANQGLPQTDEAFTNELEIFNRERGRTYQDLASSAVLAGGQEASRELANVLSARSQGFGEALGGYNALASAIGANNQLDAQALQIEQQRLNNRNAGRTQALNEELGIRGNAFNELASLLGLQQVQAPTMQSFFQPGQADFLGAQALNANMQNAQYQAELARQQAGLGGLFGLGSALLTGAGAAGGIGNLFDFRRT